MYTVQVLGYVQCNTFNFIVDIVNFIYLLFVIVSVVFCFVFYFCWYGLVFCCCYLFSFLGGCESIFGC